MSLFDCITIGITSQRLTLAHYCTIVQFVMIEQNDNVLHSAL